MARGPGLRALGDTLGTSASSPNSTSVYSPASARSANSSSAYAPAANSSDALVFALAAALAPKGEANAEGIGGQAADLSSRETSWQENFGRQVVQDDQGAPARLSQARTTVSRSFRLAFVGSRCAPAGRAQPSQDTA